MRVVDEGEWQPMPAGAFLRHVTPLIAAGALIAAAVLVLTNI